MKKLKINSKEFKKDLLFGLIIFIISALIRAIPEIKAGYWPIGYDTLASYLPEIIKFDGRIWNCLRNSNLLYLVLWFFHKCFNLDPVLTIKIGGSIIYGLMASSFYFFLRKYLKWGFVLSFITGLFLCIQIATLRLSWDLFRNMLSLIFMFPALYLLEYGKKWNMILLAFLGILIVVSNPLMAGFWVVIILFYIGYLFLINYLAAKPSRYSCGKVCIQMGFHPRGQAVGVFSPLIIKKYQRALIITACMAPCLLMFWITLKMSGTSVFGSQLIYAGGNDRVFGYFENFRAKDGFRPLVSNILSLFWLYFKFLLLPALYGFWLLRKKILLTIMTVLLLFGSFSSIIFMGFGLFVWDRWMIILVFPLTIYAVWGLRALFLKFSLNIKAEWQKTFKISVVMISILYLGLFVKQDISYLTIPYEKTRPPFKNVALNSFVPPTMVHNAIGLDGINDVSKCIDYLKVNSPEGSIIVVDGRYKGLIVNNLDINRYKIYIYSWSFDLNDELVEKIKKTEPAKPIYTIYNSQADLPSYDKVYYSGLTAVYLEK